MVAGVSGAWCAGRQFRRASGVDPVKGAQIRARAPLAFLRALSRRQPRGPRGPGSPPADTAPGATNRFAVCTAFNITIILFMFC